MILTAKTLTGLIEQIKDFEKNIVSIVKAADKAIAERDRLELSETASRCDELKSRAASQTAASFGKVTAAADKMAGRASDDLLSKQPLLVRLGECETWISLFTGIRDFLHSTMKSANPSSDNLLDQLYTQQKENDELEKMPVVTLDEIFSGRLDLVYNVADACADIRDKWSSAPGKVKKPSLRVRLKRKSAGGNLFFRALHKFFDTDFMRFMTGDKPKMPATSNDQKIHYVTLYGICVESIALLLPERERLFNEISANSSQLGADYDSMTSAGCRDFESSFSSFTGGLEKTASEMAGEYRSARSKTLKMYLSASRTVSTSSEELARTFMARYSPEAMAEEYETILGLEPVYESFQCRKVMPANIALGSMSSDADVLNRSENTLRFLRQHYFYFLHGNDIRFPYVAPFTADFNYLFRMSGDTARDIAVRDARNVGMRLFSMLPPGKLVMTFFDPVKNGDSFALFNQLISTDDRTSRVINGKAWTLPSDIEEKLRILTDHISNVTQRCLQGKYSNIFEYNEVAEQNAEPYQVLMMMDFPAGLSQNAMKLFEQIVTSGPKCGVFTILYRNESQYSKLDERSHPLVANIENSLSVFEYSEDGSKVTLPGGHNIFWKAKELTDQPYFDSIVSSMKNGIRNADRVSIDIKKLGTDDGTASATQGIRIPIGIHGASELQYLTLGVGGSHHALIAGTTGAGKSTLLHTIIVRTLMRYSPDEVVIYLVDFKRGVEFKVYTDYILPSFKVIAIESEREFGYNILKAIEREQKIRADEFRRHQGIDVIEDYREQIRKMPRILLIMDEFQELFSGEDDNISRNCAAMLERIVRQGRGFGVHLILSTQSYSNINGLSKSVYDQMAVRIVLKCSAADANLMLEGGSAEVDQISNNDPGRAIYNSEAGNKEYNSHFRVANITSKELPEILQNISDRTASYLDPKHPTRILLSNIEDNQYSFFGCFDRMEDTDEQPFGKLYIGESLGVDENMQLCLTRENFSNLLIIGNDSDRARNIFTFAMLSLCVNYWLRYKCAPKKPIITFYNANPLDDSYFSDSAELLAQLLPAYIRCISRNDDKAMQEVLTGYYESLPSVKKAARAEQPSYGSMADWFADPRTETAAPAISSLIEEAETESGQEDASDKYLFVLGYQYADILYEEQRLSSDENIGSLFNMSGVTRASGNIAPKEMFGTLLREGAQNGIHTILWHDSYEAFSQNDNNMVSYFNLRIAFEMSDADYSRFINANNVKINEQYNAILYTKIRSNQVIRPYQAPSDSWLESICRKLG